MKELFMAKKGLFIGIGAAVVAAVAAIIIIISVNKKGTDDVTGEAFRTIKVHELQGVTVIKSGEEAPINAFQGKNLKNGDDATVSADADLTLLMDSDKYIYAEGNAHFWIEASGAAGSTKSVINTDNGDTLHHLQNKLGSDEIYNVSTPASTMAVRGTVFRVVVYIQDGMYYTYLEVYQGSVEVELFTTAHESMGIRKTFGAGECALMRAGDDFSEFLGINDCEPGEPAPINYHEVPQEVALNLGKVIDSGEVLSITKELLYDYVELTPHDFEATVVTEATCTEDGESHEVCTICGLDNGTGIIPATGHVSETEVTEGTTCTEGVTTVTICAVCGEELGTETVTGEHNYGDWTETKAAGCTATGAEERVCTVCGEKETRVVRAIGHSFGDYTVVTAAGCAAEGLEKHVCANCGIEETRAIAATGHSDSINITNVPTCTVGGSQIRTCSKCGRSVTEAVAATGHKWSEWTAYDGVENCYNPGYYERYCTVDDCMESETKTVPPTGIHNWIYCNHVYMDTSSDCYVVRVCADCGDQDDEHPVTVANGGECPFCHETVGQ